MCSWPRALAYAHGWALLSLGWRCHEAILLEARRQRAPVHPRLNYQNRQGAESQSTGHTAAPAAATCCCLLLMLSCWHPPRQGHPTLSVFCNFHALLMQMDSQACRCCCCSCCCMLLNVVHLWPETMGWGFSRPQHIGLQVYGRPLRHQKYRGPQGILMCLLHIILCNT